MLSLYISINFVLILVLILISSPKPAKKIRELSIISLSSTNIPPKEVECYTKAVQTTHSSNERDGTVYLIYLNY